jgi:hypothetical protein
MTQVNEDTKYVSHASVASSDFLDFVFYVMPQIECLNAGFSLQRLVFDPV